MPWSKITLDPIDPTEALAQVGGPEDGAAVLFLGVVRNANEGRRVSGVEYEGYAEMAREELAAIVGEAAERAGSLRVGAVHRLGDLKVGEVSVAVAVSTPHRAEAFEAARYVMEEVKKRLPVWKRERYLDGEPEWLEGRTPAVAGSAKRDRGHAPPEAAGRSPAPVGAGRAPQ